METIKDILMTAVIILMLVIISPFFLVVFIYESITGRPIEDSNYDSGNDFNT